MTNSPPEFDRAVILRQPLFWSRAILWTLVGVTVIAILWAMFAEMEEVVVANGKLEPSGATREIQSPVSGVVEKVFATEGQSVKQGDLLLRVDKGVTEAKILSLEKIRSSLLAENKFYAQQMEDVVPGKIELAEPLPPELVTLARERAALLAENRLFDAEIKHSVEGLNLSSQHQSLFDVAEQDRKARLRQTELAIQQSEQQLAGAKGQLVEAEKILANDQQALDSNAGLLKKGVIAQTEFQEKERALSKSQGEVEKLRTTVAGLPSEIEKLREESRNIETRYVKDALSNQQRNRQQIAEIDSRLSKAIVDNQQRIADFESQLTQMKTALSYHDITSPVDGIVFDLGPRQGGEVVEASKVLLKIVPSEELIAKVFLTNKDIGFVHTGLKANVRIDSFPFREFGDVNGELVFIGSDALPPTPTVPTYTFPAKVQLERQFLQVRGQPIKLQAGMSVSTNIRIRKRRVISIFVDFFARPIDKLQEVR